MTKQEFIEKLEKSPLWEGDIMHNFKFKKGSPNTEVRVITSGVETDCVLIDIAIGLEQREGFSVGIDIMSDKRPYSDFSYNELTNTIHTKGYSYITLVL